MQRAAEAGYMNATELADYLARKGMPFREAHEVVGRIVVTALERGVELQQLGLEELRSMSDLIAEDVFQALSLEQTLKVKSQAGGTAPDRVREALAKAREDLKR